MVMDHFTPNKDIKAAEQCLQCRTFARQFDLDNFYDVGQMGVEHALLPEKGLVAAGECIIGADSHTCTYGGIGAFSTTWPPAWPRGSPVSRSLRPSGST